MQPDGVDDKPVKPLKSIFVEVGDMLKVCELEGWRYLPAITPSGLKVCKSVSTVLCKAAPHFRPSCRCAETRSGRPRVISRVSIVIPEQYEALSSSY